MRPLEMWTSFLPLSDDVNSQTMCFVEMGYLHQNQKLHYSSKRADMMKPFGAFEISWTHAVVDFGD